MKQKYWNALAAAAVVLSIISVIFGNDRQDVARPIRQETAYERIMRTNTIRCGYVISEPALMRDAKTGEFSGLYYDLMQEIANRLNLKIEMTFESSYGSIGEDLKTGKADMICSEGWSYIPNSRAHIIISKPVYYSPVGIYVRKDDDRFANNIGAINDPSVTISGIDGSASAVMAQEMFPKSKVLSMPQSTSYDMNLQNVIDKKSDMTFENVNFAEKFMSKRGSRELVDITKNNPARVYATGLLLPMGEVELEQMINMSITALINEGFIDKLVNKYEAAPGSLLRAGKEYEIGR